MLQPKNIVDTACIVNETIVKTLHDTTTITRITYDLTNGKSSQVILEYLKVLIWPILIIILVIIFYKQISRLFDRIANDSDEISSSLLGITAKFRRDISKISSENTDSNEFKKNIEESIKQNYIDEFKLLSSYFFTKSFQARKQTAVQIGKLAQNLLLDDLLKFASSPLAGERVGAFIGIKTHLELFSELAREEKIVDSIRIGLDDGYSRVRYRVILAISTSDYLIETFKHELETMLIEENNNPVKKEIEKLLKK